MNLKRNTVLASAVAAALGLVGGTALAAVSSGISVIPSLTFAQEIVPTSAGLTITSNAGGQLGFGVSSGQSVYLRFDLSGDGAKFDFPLATALTVGSATTITLVSGGVGSSKVIYQVTAPSTGFSQSQTYGLSPGIITVTGTTGPVTIKYAEYANAPDAASGGATSLAGSTTTLLSFAKTLDAVGQAGTSLKIDVGSNNTKFMNTAGTAAVTVSPIGEVAIGALTGRLTATGVSATYPTMVTSGVLKVQGDFSAAAASGVFLSTNTCSAGGFTPGVLNLTKTQATFNLGTSSIGTVGSTNSYEELCYKVLGTAGNPITFGVTYTATYTPTANSGYTLPPSFPMTLGTLTTNGVTAQVLNIPNATNTVDQPYIRIYNTSTLAGPIRGTLYAQDGTMLYNGVLIKSLAAHAVKILDAAQLETLAGKSWTGRAYLTVFGQIPSMDVQSLIRSGSNGTLVNVSSKAPTVKK